MKQKYYIAYGSNINKRILLSMIPEAKIVSYGYLEGYKLNFVGYDGHAIATINKSRKSKVPVAIWDFPLELRYAISNFEKYPYMYQRKAVKVNIGDKKIKGDVYIPKQQLDFGKPSKEYLDVLKEGYIVGGFDINILMNMLSEQEKEK